MLSPQHLALNREAGIAAELIASGVTLLGRASCARTGLYGQAFFNLSIDHGQRTARPSSKAAISLFGGRYRLLFLRQRHGRGFERVEPGAIIPQDLAPGLAAQ